MFNLKDPKIWSISNTFDNVFNIPSYQRPYSWDKELIEGLLNDVFDNFKKSETSDNKEGYYIGNINLSELGEAKYDKLQYDVVDGQQRLITLSLILLSLYSIMIKKDIEEKEYEDLKKLLFKKVNTRYNKDYIAVNLNSIEKDCYEKIYKDCFDDENKVEEIIKDYETNKKNSNLINAEQKLYENICIAYTFLKKNLIEKNRILLFKEYLLEKVYMIAIIAACSPNKAIEIFESVNIKRKELDELDKIKSYIFGQLKDKEFSSYAIKWGKLIKETNDNLYDYLSFFIRANIYYYRDDIKVAYISKLTFSNQIMQFYNCSDRNEAFKKLIDDMIKKVKYFKYLIDFKQARKYMNNVSDFSFYYKLCLLNEYKHPKALFMKLFEKCDGDKPLISKKVVASLITEIIKFQYKALTIQGGDSKDLISFYSDVMGYLFKCKESDYNSIILFEINTYLNSLNIINNNLINNLVRKHDVYSSKKDFCYPLLSLYNSCSGTKKKIKVQYDNAYWLYDTLVENSNLLTIDHILVQSPNKDDKKFYYYTDEKEKKLFLKKNHDFPKDEVYEGMKYTEFKKTILNKFGNLRIMLHSDNSARRNDIVKIVKVNSFYNYKNIIKNGEKMAKIIIENCLENNISNSNINKAKKIIDTFDENEE